MFRQSIKMKERDYVYIQCSIMTENPAAKKFSTKFFQWGMGLDQKDFFYTFVRYEGEG